MHFIQRESDHKILEFASYGWQAAYDASVELTFRSGIMHTVVTFDLRPSREMTDA